MGSDQNLGVGYIQKPDPNFIMFVALVDYESQYLSLFRINSPKKFLWYGEKNF